MIQVIKKQKMSQKMTDADKIKMAVAIQPNYMQLTNTIYDLVHQLEIKLDELTLLLASAMSVKDGADVFHLLYTSTNGEQAKELVNVDKLVRELRFSAWFLTQDRAFPTLNEMFTQAGRAYKLTRKLKHSGRIPADSKWTDIEKENIEGFRKESEVVKPGIDTLSKYHKFMRDESYSDIYLQAGIKNLNDFRNLNQAKNQQDENVKKNGA